MMSKKIVVFDSGIGGFSVLHEIVASRLTVEIIYLADQKFFPYGHKSSDWLAARLKKVALWAQGLSPDAFVIACNTGTVAGIESVRKVLSCPVIGVEPVIKPLSSFSSALVLATSTTVSSARTQALLDLHGHHIKLYAPPDLALYIEKDNRAGISKIIHGLMKMVGKERIEAIGLSCTHYPLILDQLKAALPQVRFYDPAPAVVKELSKQLRMSEPPKAVKNPSISFLTTGGVVRFNKQIQTYFGEELKGEKITI